MLRKFAAALAVMMGLALVAPEVQAGGRGGSRSSSSSRSYSGRSSGSSRSKGYYTGPRKPSGSYSGGSGSSHKGGSYKNTHTGDRYQKSKPR